ncbi:MAG: hypothetical protein QM791_03615 [Ferruginibacter sp.]
MNLQFTRLLKADGRLREFNFTKQARQQQPLLFCVDVTDNNFHRVYFDMLKENNNWRIVQQQIPAWVLENENNLHLVIEEELNHTAVA